jgi:hypothetical protein
MAGFRFPTWQDVSLVRSFQTGSGVHRDCYTVAKEGSFLGGKAGRREADHSPPSSVDVKNDGAIPLPFNILP